MPTIQLTMMTKNKVKIMKNQNMPEKLLDKTNTNYLSK